MDEIFRALADPNRRRLLDSLNTRDGQRLSDLCEGLEMARQSVSKHLAVLEEANLITTIRHGREKLHYLNPVPIQAIGDRWIRRYDRRRVAALADLKQALEATPMNDPAFVYTLFVRCTPERMWQALTTSEFTRRYWGLEFETDWRPGSAMTWILGDGTRIVDPEQKVIEAEPCRRLSYTWHSVTPEWAVASGIDQATRDVLAAERRSRVTFEIQPYGETVKLIVTHDDFPADSTMRAMVSTGWPRLLSDLKTLLETGETLPPVGRGDQDPADT